MKKDNIFFSLKTSYLIAKYKIIKLALSETPISKEKDCFNAQLLLILSLIMGIEMKKGSEELGSIDEVTIKNLMDLRSYLQKRIQELEHM